MMLLTTITWPADPQGDLFEIWRMSGSDGTHEFERDGQPMILGNDLILRHTFPIEAEEALRRSRDLELAPLREAWDRMLGTTTTGPQWWQDLMNMTLAELGMRMWRTIRFAAPFMLLGVLIFVLLRQL